MNQVHVHLIITHLPIFGSLLGAFVLAYGLWTSSNSTKMAAYYLLVISAIGAGIAYLTGEGAEESVEDIPGVVEKLIKEHEDFSIFALISLLVLGGAALLALYLTYKKSSASKTVAVVTLLIALISFGLVARTGFLGGKIRHTELGMTNVQKAAGIQKEGKEDD